MGRMSRNKGKIGERELSRELSRVLGVTACRGVQYSGGPDSPDIVTDIPRLHIECKRTESFRLFEALDQAIRDAGSHKTPVVMHRPNRRPWIVVLRLDDLPELARQIHEYQTQKQEKENEPT